MELFTIQCTTCHARLKVLEESVIGDILACPKCGSMVQVVPPVGWKSAGDTASAELSFDGPPPVVAPSKKEKKKTAAIPPALPARSAVPTKPVASPAKSQPAPATPNSPAPDSRTNPFSTEQMKAAVMPPALDAQAAKTKPKALATTPPQNERGRAAAAAVIAPLAAPTAEATPAGQPPGGLATIAGAPPIESTAPGASTSITSRIRPEWYVWGSGLLAGVVLGAGLWLVLMQMGDTPDTPADVGAVQLAALDPNSAPAAANPVVEPQTKVPQPAAQQPVLPDPAAKVGDAAPAGAPLGQAPANNEPAPADQTAAAGGQPAEVAPAANPALAHPTRADDAPAANDVAANAAEPRGPTLKLDPAPPAPQKGAPAEPPAPSDADEPADDALSVRVVPATVVGEGGRPDIGQTDVEERLRQPLATVEFSSASLAQFVEFFSEIANLTITFDDAALKRVGQRRQSLLSVKLGETTAGDALRTGLAKLGLTLIVRNGQAVVTAANDARPINVRPAP